MTSLLSFAKINVGLSVGSYRADEGLSEIDSLFVPIDWGDTIQISPFRDAPILRSVKHPSNVDHIDTKISLQFHNHIAMPLPYQDFSKVIGLPEKLRKNLVYKVLRSVYELDPSIPSYHIEISKNIPTGAGLGGGSSNAGTLLAYFIREGHLSTGDAFSIAKRLGSDISFFVSVGLDNDPAPRSYRVTGIGDKMQKHPMPQAKGVLFLSNITIFTHSAYHSLKRALQKNLIKNQCLISKKKNCFVRLLDRSVLNLYNDFAPVIYAENPFLKHLHDFLLDEGADFVQMTGTGSAIYVLVDTKRKQLALLENVRLKQMQREQKIQMQGFSCY